MPGGYLLVSFWVTAVADGDILLFDRQIAWVNFVLMVTAWARIKLQTLIFKDFYSLENYEGLVLLPPSKRGDGPDAEAPGDLKESKTSGDGEDSNGSKSAEGSKASKASEESSGSGGSHDADVPADGIGPASTPSSTAANATKSAGDA